MNDNLHLLVNALKNPNNKQIKYQLQDDTGYCVLGLACQVYADITGKGKWNKLDPSGYHSFCIDQFCYTIDIPEKVRKFFGITTTTTGLLGIYNDEGRTFLELAKLIEETQQHN